MTSNLLNELKRRNVLRVLVAYLALGWLVLQVAETLSPAFNLPEWTIRFLLVTGGLGLPFVLFFSWAFEITPEGIKREEDVQRQDSITNVTAKKLDLAIIALLVTTLGYTIFQSNIAPSEPINADIEVTSKTPPPTSENHSAVTSIAVLPFANMSSDPEQEYFSDGITEELLNLLAKIPDLKVAARTSSFQFKNKHVNIKDVARQLGVKMVLEGSIRKSGDKIRITAQLIKADDGFHVWSETYDEQLNDIFAIQDKISAAIVSSLKDTLGIELRVTLQEPISIDPVAHDFYLKGLQGLYVQSFSGLRMAQDYLQRAVNLAPEFTAARLSLAEAIYKRHNTGDMEGTDQQDQAIAMLEDILKSEPDNIDALYLLAAVTRWIREKYDYSLEVFQKAYAINPYHGRALESIAFYALNFGWQADINKQELIKVFTKLTSEDPLNSDLYYHWGMINSQLFLDYETAEKMYRRATELNPADGNPMFFNALLRVNSMGDIAGAIPLMEQVAENDKTDPDGSIYLAMAYNSLDDNATAEKWIIDALSKEPNSGQAKFIKSLILYDNGHEEQAYKEIETVLNNKEVFHRRGSQFLMGYLAVHHLLKKGQADKASDFIRKYYPQLVKVLNAPPPEKLNDLRYAEPLFATIEQAAGNTENFNKLSQRLALFNATSLLGNKPRLSGNSYLILAASGSGRIPDDEVITFLEKAIDSGQLMSWKQRILFNPVFLPLADHPRFKALIEKIQAEVSRQRGFL